jgi:hypothetical protein
MEASTDRDPGAAMATIHQTTTAMPEQFLADGYLKVHDQGPVEADVTEGSNGAWEGLHYAWSDPHRITMTTTDYQPRQAQS